MTSRILLRFLLLSVLAASPAVAQDETPFLVAPAERGIVLRWVWDEGPRPAGYFVERRQGSNPAWTRLTARPITRSRDRAFAREQLGARFDRYSGLLFPEDPRAERADPETFHGMLLLSADVEPGVARVLGLRYDDTEATTGVVYQYRLIALTASGERVVATSGAVGAGGYRPALGPTSIAAATAPRGAALRWMPPPQFSAYHVYRASRRDGSDARRLNEVPVLLFTRDEGSSMEASAVFFTDTAPPARDTVFYSVAGIDAFGRVSQRSAATAFVFRPIAELNAPVLVQTRIAGDTVVVSWQPPSDQGVTAVQLWRAPSDTGPFVRIGQPLPASQREYRDSGRPARRLNWYRVTALYGATRESDPSALALAEVPDLTPPAAPDSVRSVADTGRISLSWRRVAASDLRGYRVYRASTATGEFGLLSQTPDRNARFVDTIRLRADHPFFYRITAVDSAFNESAPSAVVTVRPPDATPPSAPRIANARALNGALAVSWLPNPEPDVVSYRLRYRMKGQAAWRDAPSLLADGISSDTITDLTAGETYEVSVVAADDAGNESLPAPTVERTIRRLTLPRPDLRRAAVAERDGHRTVVVSWSLEGSEVVELLVLRREEGVGQSLRPIASVPAGTSEYVDKTIRAGRSYEYVLRVRDRFGNASESRARRVEIPEAGS